MVTIVFESHSTTFDNEADLASGYYDVDLSPLGQQQAGELGERYKDNRFAAIYCSDLKRSYLTGEIAFGQRDFPVIKDPRLKEVDYGDFTRHPSKGEVEGIKGQYLDTPFPNGESYRQTAERMKFFLQDLLKDHEGQKVMIIGHRATQYGLEHWINKVDLKKAVTDPWQWQPGWVYKLSELK